MKQAAGAKPPEQRNMVADADYRGDRYSDEEIAFTDVVSAHIAVRSDKNNGGKHDVKHDAGRLFEFQWDA